MGKNKKREKAGAVPMTFRDFKYIAKGREILPSEIKRVEVMPNRVIFVCYEYPFRSVDGGLAMDIREYRIDDVEVIPL